MFRALGALGRRLLLGRQLELALPDDVRERGGNAGTATAESSRGGPPPEKKSLTSAINPHHSIAPPAELLPNPDARAFLAQLRAIGLTGIRHLTLTSNRSTVVSFRADQLRVHRAFLAAPPDVLCAIVSFVNGRGAVHRRARRELLAFEIPRDAQAASRRRRREAPHPDDAILTQRLADAHRQLNQDRFNGALGEISIRISRRMRSRLGHFSPGHGDEAPEIAIARRHLRRDGWTSAVDTLAHEMVHQWQHETNRPLAHDPDFRRKAREIGIHPAARRMAGRPS